jgi:hypothetical protein
MHQSYGFVGPKISEALETYLELKGSGKGELFSPQTEEQCLT